MILLIDNYDSFAHNLARYLRQLGQKVWVVRNDTLSIEDITLTNPAAIVMSPGPCTPGEAGICLQVVKQLHRSIPMLGVCLGHQAICQAFGANIVRTFPVHGQASAVEHRQHSLFQEIDSPFMAGRYHSLIADGPTLPVELEVLATTNRDVIMAVGHRQFPVFGVQFHPESVLTEGGYQLLENFLRLAGIDYNRIADAGEPKTPLAMLPVAESNRNRWSTKRPHQYQ